MEFPFWPALHGKKCANWKHCIFHCQRCLFFFKCKTLMPCKSKFGTQNWVAHQWKQVKNPLAKQHLNTKLWLNFHGFYCKKNGQTKPAITIVHFLHKWKLRKIVYAQSLHKILANASKVYEIFTIWPKFTIVQSKVWKCHWTFEICTTFWWNVAQTIFEKLKLKFPLAFCIQSTQ